MKRNILYLQNKSEDPECCIREMKGETYTTSGTKKEQKTSVDSRTRNPGDVSDKAEGNERECESNVVHLSGRSGIAG